MSFEFSIYALFIFLAIYCLYSFVKNNEKIAEKLIKLGADPYFNYFGKTPLFGAISSSVANVLLRAGAALL
ncbi:MAG: hypothetical protein R3B45_10035 [Bdellovibrionota bacterium]